MRIAPILPWLLALPMCVVPAVSHSQIVRQVAFHHVAASDTCGEPLNYGRAVSGGLAAGAMGLLVGGGAGVAAAQRCHTENCGYEAVLAGAVIGESVALALGAHDGSGSRGTWLPSVLASVAIGGAFAYAAVGAGAGAAPLVIVMPVAQLLTVLGLEQSASRRSD